LKSCGETRFRGGRLRKMRLSTSFGTRPASASAEKNEILFNLIIIFCNFLLLGNDIKDKIPWRQRIIVPPLNILGRFLLMTMAQIKRLS